MVKTAQDEVLELKAELDEVNCRCRQLMKQVDELEKDLITKEAQLKASDQTVDLLSDRIKFLEGQVDAYQYCLNCRR